jgi:hypothetical protein
LTGGRLGRALPSYFSILLCLKGTFGTRIQIGYPHTILARRDHKKKATDRPNPRGDRSTGSTVAMIDVSSHSQKMRKIEVFQSFVRQSDIEKFDKKYDMPPLREDHDVDVCDFMTDDAKKFVKEKSKNLGTPVGVFQNASDQNIVILNKSGQKDKKDDKKDDEFTDTISFKLYTHEKGNASWLVQSKNRTTFYMLPLKRSMLPISCCSCQTPKFKALQHEVSLLFHNRFDQKKVTIDAAIYLAKAKLEPQIKGNITPTMDSKIKFLATLFECPFENADCNVFQEAAIEMNRSTEYSKLLSETFNVQGCMFHSVLKFRGLLPLCPKYMTQTKYADFDGMFRDDVAPSLVPAVLIGKHLARYDAQVAESYGISFMKDLLGPHQESVLYLMQLFKDLNEWPAHLVGLVRLCCAIFADVNKKHELCDTEFVIRTRMPDEFDPNEPLEEDRYKAYVKKIPAWYQAFNIVPFLGFGDTVDVYVHYSVRLQSCISFLVLWHSHRRRVVEARLAGIEEKTYPGLEHYTSYVCKEEGSFYGTSDVQFTKLDMLEIFKHTSEDCYLHNEKAAIDDEDEDDPPSCEMCTNFSRACNCPSCIFNRETRYCRQTFDHGVREEDDDDEDDQEDDQDDDEDDSDDQEDDDDDQEEDDKKQEKARERQRVKRRLYRKKKKEKKKTLQAQNAQEGSKSEEELTRTVAKVEADLKAAIEKKVVADQALAKAEERAANLESFAEKLALDVKEKTLRESEMMFSAALEAAEREASTAVEALTVAKDKLACVVCFEAERNVLSVKCKHLCLCFHCSNLVKNVCPICRCETDFLSINIS